MCKKSENMQPLNFRWRFDRLQSIRPSLARHTKAASAHLVVCLMMMIIAASSSSSQPGQKSATCRVPYLPGWNQAITHVAVFLFHSRRSRRRRRR